MTLCQVQMERNGEHLELRLGSQKSRDAPATSSADMYNLSHTRDNFTFNIDSATCKILRGEYVKAGMKKR